MLRNLTEYHWAEHIDDALDLLARLDVKTVPLAGGTHLLCSDDDSIEAVVDLRELGLSYATEDGRGDIHIGAMTSLQNMVDAPLLKSFASGLLSRSALVSSSSRLIRSSATLGGTLAIGATSQADLLTALSVLEAQTVVRSTSRTSVNLSGGTAERPGLSLSGLVYKGKQERRIASDNVAVERHPSELIVETVLPALHSTNGACATSFSRVGRTFTDVAYLNVATLVEIEQDTYTRVRLAIGGANMKPQRLFEVEQALVGKPIDGTANIVSALQTGMAEFRPPADIRVSAGYRRVSGAKLAQRVLEEATFLARHQGLLAAQNSRNKGNGGSR